MALNQVHYLILSSNLSNSRRFKRFLVSNYNLGLNSVARILRFVKIIKLLIVK